MKREIGFEIYFWPDFRVFLKKYCCKCGKKLKRKIGIIKGFEKHSSIFFEDRYKKTYTISLLYYCKKCKYSIEYDNQKKIDTIQKESKYNIIDNHDILINQLKN